MRKSRVEDLGMQQLMPRRDDLAERPTRRRTALVVPVPVRFPFVLRDGGVHDWSHVVQKQSVGDVRPDGVEPDGGGQERARLEEQEEVRSGFYPPPSVSA